jgi:hypothetical protein
LAQRLPEHQGCPAIALLRVQAVAVVARTILLLAMVVTAVCRAAVAAVAAQQQQVALAAQAALARAEKSGLWNTKMTPDQPLWM